MACRPGGTPENCASPAGWVEFQGLIEGEQLGCLVVLYANAYQLDLYGNAYKVILCANAYRGVLSWPMWSGAREWRAI